jgi:CTP:molybdopterin cytidylyltransferase MocA
MGRPKPLLSWHGVPLIEYQIASLVAAGVSEVVVVLGHEHELVAPHVSGDGVHHVVNAEYRKGKATSVRAGLGAVDVAATDILLLAVDQPRPPEIIFTVIGSHVGTDALITSPRYSGRGGHPLVFSARLRGELEAISEETQGVREVFRAHAAEVNEVDIDDPVIRLDINDAEAYEEALRLFGG